MTEAERWSGLDSAGDIAAALTDLYEERGGAHYDEVVTLTEHSRQCGALAMAAEADSAVIGAAFLHDIGHLLTNRHDRERDLRHEETGARLLARWFGADLVEPIRLHVAAKRYLCTTADEYTRELSPASVATLVLQGGPMDEAEIAEFEREPGAATAIDLRRWDDRAKVRGAPTPRLDVFEDLLVDLIDERGTIRGVRS